LVPDEIKLIKIAERNRILFSESYGDLWNMVNSAQDVTVKFITEKFGESALERRGEHALNKPESFQIVNIPVTDLFNSINSPSN